MEEQRNTAKLDRYLSSFDVWALSVGFGYTSVVVWRLGKREGRSGFMLSGMAGTAISAAFALAKLLPRLTVVETMGVESYFLLALWCLLGFAFYWRVMRTVGFTEDEHETVAIGVLFALLLYSAMVWYIRKMVEIAGGALEIRTVFPHAFILVALVMLSLALMLMILDQLKKRQLTLEQERIHAVESSRTKSHFLFNMSHDLRTPMNAIMGYTRLALRAGEAGEREQFLHKIDDSSAHLLRLIDDILEMSSIENDEVRLELRPTDLRDVLDEVRTLFDPQMREKQLDFTVRRDQLRHARVMCDGESLSRVLFNMVENAWKFTPSGGSVGVFLRETGASDDSADYEIRVTDTGIGMSAELAEKVFNAFERERTSTDSGVQGTGLGLSIACSILQRMGGEVQVNSVRDQGSEFIICVSFPLCGEEAPAPAAPAAEEPADFTGRRVLLVEDNEINREIAVMILTEVGFSVDTAENGAVGVEKVRKSDYDAVLMDIQMPVMDGYEATRAVRALEEPQKRAVPIVALTAKVSPEDEQKARDCGMQAHLAKPLDVDKMMQTLREVLGISVSR